MKDRWKIIFAVGAFLVVFTGILLLTMRLQPESKLEAYKTSLREKGEKLEISEVLPPPVPAESNSVDAVEDAFRMFGSGDTEIPDAMKMVAPGRAMAAWRQPDVRGWDFTNSWVEFGNDLAPDQPAIELLHQVLERPRLDFQLDYTKGAALLLPHLMPMKRAAQKLEAAAIFDLHNGDTGAAATNILTLLALVQRNTSEGLLISHLVRIAMTAIAIAPTWEFLQATNITDAQLAVLQAGWVQMDFLSDAENAFRFERAWMPAEIEKYRSSHEEFQKAFGMTSFVASSSTSASGGWGWETLTEKPRYAVGEVMWRSSWSYADELQTLQEDQAIVETLRAMQTNRSEFYKADYDAMASHMKTGGVSFAGKAFFRALKIPDFSEEFGSGSLSRVILKDLRIEAARRVVVTAVALKRFQLKHGKWPETLGELVPEFLLSVPIDPYDGKPLKYDSNADGTYLLYSVGEDGVDDGGNPTLPTGMSSSSLYWQNPKAHDWVWPQPATEAEIKYFYEHPPK